MLFFLIQQVMQVDYVYCERIYIQIMECNLNIINCVIKMDDRTNNYLMSLIYSSLDPGVRQAQWSMMRFTAQHYKIPWTVIGDLNFILTAGKKRRGNLVSRSQIDSANAMLDGVRMHFLPYIGNLFTWTNRRKSQELIL